MTSNNTERQKDVDCFVRSFTQAVANEVASRPPNSILPDPAAFSGACSTILHCLSRTSGSMPLLTSHPSSRAVPFATPSPGTRSWRETPGSQGSRGHIHEGCSYDSCPVQDVRVAVVPSCPWGHGLTTQSSHQVLWPISHSCQRRDFATSGLFPCGRPTPIPRADDDPADDPCPVLTLATARWDSRTTTRCRLLPKTEGWFSHTDLRRLHTSRSSFLGPGNPNLQSAPSLCAILLQALGDLSAQEFLHNTFS